MATTKERAARLEEIKDKHSENLRALAVSTSALKESNNRLEKSLMLPRGIRPDDAVEALWPPLVRNLAP